MDDRAFRTPVTLRGPDVVLEPLATECVRDLAVAGRSPEVWRYLRIGPGRTEEEMARLVASILADRDEGTVQPFVVRALRLGRIVGMLRYFHIDRENGTAEIGTWLDPVVWRTGVNPQAKYLALRYAFEEAGAHRVVLKTDEHNARSARAILRLGATREGMLREHVRAPDGHFSSSIVFSLLASEWPAVKSRLEATIAPPPAAGPR